MLPDGLTISSGSIVISGTPTTVGTWTFTIIATDEGLGCAIGNEYSITITEVPASIPTISEWGIIIMFTLLAFISILWIKCRRVYIE